MMTKEKANKMMDTIGEMCVVAWDAWEDACAEDDVFSKICMTNLVHSLNGATNALAQFLELKEEEGEDDA